MGADMEDQTKYSEIYKIVAPVGRDKILVGSTNKRKLAWNFVSTWEENGNA